MPYPSPPPTFTLNVDSNPKGASIYLDGQFRGTTPATVPNLRGSYSLRVSLTGYHDRTETVSVLKHETVSFSLIPVMCVLAIDSKPQGAAIYINGLQRGNTPAKLSGTKGMYAVKLTLPGYRDYDATVDVAGMTEVLFNLSPARKS